jgi:hypothetical protein
MHPTLGGPDLAAEVRIHPPDEVLGESWAAKRPPGPDAQLLAAKPRHPCPICGHPTGDCTGEESHG